MFRYCYIFFCSLFLLISTGLNAQYEQKVKEIQRAAARIDSSGKYTVKELNDSCFVAKGRSLQDTLQVLRAYYKKQQLVKMVYVLRFSNGITTEKLYFEAGQLILIKVLTEIYPRQKNGTLQNVYIPKVIYKASYFFQNNELLEFHNFGKGPMDHLSRAEKGERLMKNCEKYRNWLAD